MATSVRPRAFPAASVRLALLALVVLVAAGCSYTVSERHLFHPARLPVLPDAVTRRNVAVRAADGTMLRGWFLGRPGSRRALLYFYGNGESVLGISPLLFSLAERLDADILAVDYRGYGFSDGAPDFEKIAADGPLLYDTLVALAGPGEPAFVFGRSLGTVFALATATARPAAGVILQAPPTSIAAVVAAWQRELPWYLRFFVRLRPDERLRNLHPQPGEEAERLTRPLLVVHGTADRTIPVAQGREILARAGSSLKSLCEIEGAGHNDLDVLRGPAAVCLRAFLDEAARRRAGEPVSR